MLLEIQKKLDEIQALLQNTPPNDAAFTVAADNFLAIETFIQDLDDNREKAQIRETIADLKFDLSETMEDLEQRTSYLLSACSCYEMAVEEISLSIDKNDLELQIKSYELIISQLVIYQRLLELSDDNNYFSQITQLLVNTDIFDKLATLLKDNQDDKVAEILEDLEGFRSYLPQSSNKRSAEKHSTKKQKTKKMKPYKNDDSDDDIEDESHQIQTSNNNSKIKGVVITQGAAKKQSGKSRGPNLTKINVTDDEPISAPLQRSADDKFYLSIAAREGITSTNRNFNLSYTTNYIPHWAAVYYVIAYRVGAAPMDIIQSVIDDTILLKNITKFHEIKDHMEYIIEQVKEKHGGKNDYITRAIDKNKPGTAILPDEQLRAFKLGIRSGGRAKYDGYPNSYPTNKIINWYGLAYYIGYTAGSSGPATYINKLMAYFKDRSEASFNDVINEISNIIAMKLDSRKKATTNFAKHKEEVVAKLTSSNIEKQLESAGIAMTKIDSDDFARGMHNGGNRKRREMGVLVKFSADPTWYNLGDYIGRYFFKRGAKQFIILIQSFAKQYHFNNLDNLINNLDLLIAYIEKKLTVSPADNNDLETVAVLEGDNIKSFSTGLMVGAGGRTDDREATYESQDIINWYMMGYVIGHKTKSRACTNLVSCINEVVRYSGFVTFQNILDNGIDIFITRVITMLQDRKHMHYQKFAATKKSNRKIVVNQNEPGTGKPNAADVNDFAAGVAEGSRTRKAKDRLHNSPTENITSWYQLGYYIGYYKASSAIEAFIKNIEKFNSNNPPSSFNDLLLSIDAIFDIKDKSVGVSFPGSFFYAGDEWQATDKYAELGTTGIASAKIGMNTDPVEETDFIRRLNKKIHSLRKKVLNGECYKTTAYFIAFARNLLMNLPAPHHKEFESLSHETSRVELFYRLNNIKQEPGIDQPSRYPVQCAVVPADRGLNNGITDVSTGYAELEDGSFREYVSTNLDNDNIMKNKVHIDKLSEALMLSSKTANQLLIGHVGLDNSNHGAGHVFTFIATPNTVYFVDADVLGDVADQEFVFKQDKLNFYYNFTTERKNDNASNFFPDVFYSIHHLLPLTTLLAKPSEETTYSSKVSGL